MRLSTHNGLETWVEWRPSQYPSEIQIPWTRVTEVPIRLATGEDYQKATSSLQIDLDKLAHCDTTPEYRVAVKQSNYTDWCEELKVVISNDRILKTGYLLPEHKGETKYFELEDWSTLSQDEKEALEAARLVAGPTMNLEDELSALKIPPIEGDGLIDKRSLEALLESLDEPSDGDRQMTKQPGIEVPGQSLITGPKTSSLADGDTTASGRIKAPSLIQEVPIIATTCLEVAVYRGQYIRLPATPPPSYSEKELPARLYHGTSSISFAAEHEQWIGADKDTPWCRFVYQPEFAQRIAPSTEPEILSDEMCEILRKQLDKYAEDLVAQAEGEKRQKHRAERRKIKEMERERIAEIEKQRQEEIQTEEAAMAQRQARSDASKKAWARRRGKEGRTMATTVPAIRRLQQEESATAGPSKRRLDHGFPRFGERVDRLSQHRSGGGDSHRSGFHQPWSEQSAERISRQQPVKYCQDLGPVDPAQSTMNRQRPKASTHDSRRQALPPPDPTIVLPRPRTQTRRSTPFIDDSGCLIPATPSPEPERKPRVKSEHSDTHRGLRHDRQGPRISHEAVARARATRLASKRTDGPRHSILPRRREPTQRRRSEVSEEEEEAEELRPMDRQREAYRERERERDHKRAKREAKENQRMARGSGERAKGKESTLEGGYREPTPLPQRQKHRDEFLKAIEDRADKERKRGVKSEPKRSEIIDLTQLSD